MSFKEVLKGDLVEVCEMIFEKSKDSSKKFRKFKTGSHYGSIVVYWSDRAEKYKWFAQGDPSQKFDIGDGMKFGLWRAEDFGGTSFYQNSIPKRELEKKEKESTIDLEEYENSLLPITTYNYRCIWFSIPRNFNKNSKGSLALPSFLFRNNKFEKVGFIEKHPKGFSKYVGERGLIIAKFGTPKIFYIGESIIDLFAFSKLYGVKKENVLFLASQGNFSNEMILTIKALSKLYKPKKIFTNVDNDEAGEKYRKLLNRELDITLDFIPNDKDFLDDFCKQKKVQVPF